MNLTRRDLLSSIGVGAIASLAGCGYQAAGGERVWESRQQIAHTTTIVAGETALFGARQYSGRQFDWDREQWYDAEETVLTKYDPHGYDGSFARFEPQYAIPPVVTDSYVFIGGSTGEVVAVNITESEFGDVTWRYQTDQDIHTLVATESIVACYTADEQLLALDPTSGNERWQTRVNGRSELDCVAIGEQVLFVTVDDNTVHIASIMDGDEQWTAQYLQPAADSHHELIDVAVHDDTLIISSHNRGTETDTILAINSTDGSVRWSIEPMPQAIGAAPIVTSEHVYVPVRRGLITYGFTHGEHRWDLDATYRRQSSVVADRRGVYLFAQIDGRPNPRLLALSPGGEHRWDTYLGDDFSRIGALYLCGETLITRASSRFYGFRTTPGRRLSLW